MLPSASVWERALLPEGHGHLLLPKSGGLLLLASSCWCSVFFVDLMELPLHEITQLTEMGKQQLQPRAQSPSLFFFLGCFIQHRGSLEEDGVCAPV